MSDTVSSETIDRLADKLSAFAESLNDDERTALDLFFLQESDVEGFAMDDGSRTGAGSPKVTQEIRRESLRQSLRHGLAQYYPPTDPAPMGA